MLMGVCVRERLTVSGPLRLADPAVDALDHVGQDRVVLSHGQASVDVDVDLRRTGVPSRLLPNGDHHVLPRVGVHCARCDDELVDGGAAAVEGGAQVRRLQHVVDDDVVRVHAVAAVEDAAPRVEAVPLHPPLERHGAREGAGEGAAVVVPDHVQVDEVVDAVQEHHALVRLEAARPREGGRVGGVGDGRRLHVEGVPQPGGGGVAAELGEDGGEEAGDESDEQDKGGHAGERSSHGEAAAGVAKGGKPVEWECGSGGYGCADEVRGGLLCDASPGAPRVGVGVWCVWGMLCVGYAVWSVSGVRRCGALRLPLSACLVLHGRASAVSRTVSCWRGISHIAEVCSPPRGR